MVVKKTRYSKKFITETDEKDISHHGSPVWKSYQDMCCEDKELRKKVIKKFALESINFPTGMGSGTKYYGFDGKQQYSFQISYPLPLEKPEDPEEHFKYETTFKIRKAGNEEDLKEPSDLEKFLISKGFKEKHID